MDAFLGKARAEVSNIRVDVNRDDVRRWAENWRCAGIELDAERWRRLVAMTDDERRVMALELLSLDQPEKSGDDGAGLLAIKKAFEKWQRIR